MPIILKDHTQNFSLVPTKCEYVRTQTDQGIFLFFVFLFPFLVWSRFALQSHFLLHASLLKKTLSPFLACLAQFFVPGEKGLEYIQLESPFSTRNYLIILPYVKSALKRYGSLNLINCQKIVKDLWLGETQ